MLLKEKIKEFKTKYKYVSPPKKLKVKGHIAVYQIDVKNEKISYYILLVNKKTTEIYDVKRVAKNNIKDTVYKFMNNYIALKEVSKNIQNQKNKKQIKKKKPNYLKIQNKQFNNDELLNDLTLLYIVYILLLKALVDSNKATIDEQKGILRYTSNDPKYKYLYNIWVKLSNVLIAQGITTDSYREKLLDVRVENIYKEVIASKPYKEDLQYDKEYLPLMLLAYWKENRKHKRVTLMLDDWNLVFNTVTEVCDILLQNNKLVESMSDYMATKILELIYGKDITC